MNAVNTERTIRFTEDEAIGLLDIVLLCPVELSPEQRVAAEKLSKFCRELYREAAELCRENEMKSLEPGCEKAEFAARELLPSA